MKFEFLWTDYCLFILLLVAMFGLFHGMKKAHIRLALKQIFKRRLATASLIVLLLFIVIGLLDSIHFKQAVMVNNQVHYSTHLHNYLSS